MSPLNSFLPSHLRHLEHSKLFKALESAIEPFRKNQIVDDEFLWLLFEALAIEFEKSCESVAVKDRVLVLPSQPPIVNYRFDRGYWELVLPKTQVVVRDKSQTIYEVEANLVSIEGSGSGLRKGKRKTESVKRAFSRQMAKDSRRDEDSSDPSSEDGDWIP